MRLRAPLDRELGNCADRLQAVELGVLITSHCHLAVPSHLLGEKGAFFCLPYGREGCSWTNKPGFHKAHRTVSWNENLFHLTGEMMFAQRASGQNVSEDTWLRLQSGEMWRWRGRGFPVRPTRLES
jgi:hypothetical protein